MHSLKNTVIAVCLLGLSFVFYQASSKNSSDDDLIPAINIAEKAASPSPNAIGSEIGNDDETSDFAIVEMPPVRPSRATPPPFAPENNINKSSESTKPFTPAAPGLLKLGNSPPPMLSSPESMNQPSTNIDRDRELIAALKTQNQSRSSRDFATAPIQDDNAFQINPGTLEQPKPSFTRQVSADPAMERSEGVVNADRVRDFSDLNLSAAWAKVDQLISEDDLQSAHRLLSRFYHSNEATGPQRQRLIGWLDALAGKVIFSDEHLVTGTPYIVKPNESLTDIGQQWNVPGQLVYNINRNNIPNPLLISPGTQLKSVKGPFRAEIDLQNKIMTLFLGDLYAGRYPIYVGISGTPSPGDFSVVEKSENGHAWRDAAGNVYDPDSSQNGYGRNWIGLTGKLCIHAVSDTTRDGHHGCIGLSDSDAKDVFAILAMGSKISIIR